jgi:DNA-binding transcriptional LysR family regulator
VRGPRDVRADTIISFPAGCTYRRLLQAWLGAGGVMPEKILELGSYHAIVACVASGTGIAFVPRSVLATISGAREVAVHALGRGGAAALTSLVWRRGETSPALLALQAELATDRGARRPHPRAPGRRQAAQGA